MQSADEFARDLIALAEQYETAALQARQDGDTVTAARHRETAKRYRRVGGEVLAILATRGPQPASHYHDGMSQAVQGRLRAPFKPGQLTMRPRIVCDACALAVEDPGAKCPEHRRLPCDDCGHLITTAHRHVESVTHTDVIDRYLDVDATWYWRPAATTPQGLPAFDDDGGLWMYVTVAGIERLTYGDADGLKGTAAAKAAVSNGIRLSGKAFGVPTRGPNPGPPLETDDHDGVDATDRTDRTDDGAPDEPPMASTEQINTVVTELNKRGVRSKNGTRRALKKHLGYHVASARALTAAEADRVLTSLTGPPSGAQTVLAKITGDRIPAAPR